MNSQTIIFNITINQLSQMINADEERIKDFLISNHLALTQNIRLNEKAFPSF